MSIPPYATKSAVGRVKKRVMKLEHIGATGSGGVTSFNSRTGTVTPALNDYTWAQIDKATSNITDITTKNVEDLTYSDNTTNNASTSKHGLLKKLSNVATEFMNGVGNWTALVSSPWTKKSDDTLGANAATITTGTTLTGKVFDVLIFAKNTTAANNSFIRLNGDTGNNYNFCRQNVTAGAQTVVTATSQSSAVGPASDTSWYVVRYHIEKQSTGAIGAITGHGGITTAAQETQDMVASWNNTTDLITSITYGVASNELAAGTRMIVLEMS